MSKEIQDILPDTGDSGLWAGRAWVPSGKATNGRAGPRVISIRDGQAVDVTDTFPMMASLVNQPNCGELLKKRLADAPVLCPLDQLLDKSLYSNRAESVFEEQEIVLLAPNDILATKACGVTFIRSLLERVIEEKAKGDPVAASKVRQTILDTLGDDLSRVKPGSPETMLLKQQLIGQGVWSQYLEVGIGPDAEVFTKTQPMASVGFGSEIGVLPDSKWNNPEPEIVLAVSCRGEIVGATLGNDVNLRDYEGRSALLLGEAKDQNGSCAIGPFIRLFDAGFTIGDVKACEIELKITGEDGFTTHGRSRMSEISRSPEELVAQAIGDNHQYPDGLVLFLGTMFAPTDDRDNPGEGFTHHIGDRVEISTPHLGRLVNWVNHTDKIPRWEFGITQLIEYLNS